MNISGNISSRIGALEFSDAVAAMNDGVLEDTAESLYAGPTTNVMSCMGTATQSIAQCRRIDDGALEEAGGYMSVGPSGSHCNRPTEPIGWCKPWNPGPVTMGPQGVHRVDDGALENAAGTLYAGASMEGPCGLTSPQLCRRRIDDGALEAAAGSTYVGATVDAMGCPGGAPMTKSIIYCRRIDDGALEDAAGYSAVGPSSSPGDCYRATGNPFACRRIDDSALEASAEMTMHPATAWRNPMGQCV